MKVLFIPDNFPPEVNALARRTFEHCVRWVQQGVDVTVITCAPNFPQGRIYPGYRNKLYQKETMAGIEVQRVWSYIAPNAGFGRRILDQLSFAFTAFVTGLFCKADIFIASTPHFFPVVTACMLSMVKRRPWIFEVRDLWTDSIMAVGVMRRNLLIRTLERLERFLYRRATCIVVVSPAFKDRLVRDGINPAKIEIITNGVDRAQFCLQERDNELAGQFGLHGKFVFGYVGTHGMAHALDFILRAASKIHDSRIHFLFIGDGAEKSALRNLANDLHLSNLTFLDPVPAEFVPRYLSVLDVALVPLRKSETFLTVIPSKIFEAASMQKPILLGVDGQARAIMEQYDSGVFFEPEDEAAFIAAVGRMASDVSLIRRLKTGSENLANAYDRLALADRMLEVIRAIVGDASAAPKPLSSRPGQTA